MMNRCKKYKTFWLIFLVLMFFIGNGWSATVTTIATGFNGSGDLLVDENADIYNANFGVRLSNANGTSIVKITPDGQVAQFASGFIGASGMDIDSAGNIIQANINGNSISRVTPEGIVTTIASEGFNGPVGVAINSNDQIFVANCRNNTISRIENGIGVIFSSGSLFRCPNGLAADDQNNLYAVNFNNGEVIKIDSQGNATLLADSGGGNGHIVFGNNRLYFTNHGLSQVFEMSLDGTLKVLAGTGSKGHQDGAALNATFSALNGIGISPDGKTVYVNEPVALGGAASISLTPSVLRAIHLDDDAPTFDINPGLAGSWYEPETSGQGFVIDFVVAEERFDLLLYWFTYNDMGIGVDNELSGFGSTQSRWFTAQGRVEGAAVNMPIARTAGGIFDRDDTVASDAVGSIDLEFLSCEEAILTYTFDVPETKMGTIELQRLVPDIWCESLASQN